MIIIIKWLLSIKYTVTPAANWAPHAEPEVAQSLSDLPYCWSEPLPQWLHRASAEEWPSWRAGLKPEASCACSFFFWVGRWPLYLSLHWPMVSTGLSVLMSEERSSGGCYQPSLANQMLKGLVYFSAGVWSRSTLHHGDKGMGCGRNGGHSVRANS
jgi:hypothetical protein